MDSNFSRLKNFSGGVDAPPLVRLRTHQSILVNVCSAAMEAAQSVGRKSSADDTGQLLDDCANYDGT